MNFKVDLCVCRVCMKSDVGTSLFKDRSLHEKFVYTTKLKVKEDDSMPQILCDKCVARLKVSYEFCRLANSTEKQLRTFINKISNDFQQVASKSGPVDEEDDLSFMGGDDEETIVLTLGEEAVGSDQAEVEPINTKKEPMDESTEVELLEVLDDITAPKPEISENEVYMEEFHEIIQEDNGDGNLYLDENSAEELQLYEDQNELFDDEEEGYEGESNPTEQLDAESANEEKTLQIDEKKKKRKSPRQSKRSKTAAPPKLEGSSNICIKCNKDFSTKTNLMRHMSTHNGVKPYQCTVCGKGFTQNGSLKQHMFIHTGERPHVCRVCQRGFTQSKSLIFHMRRHTGEKPFACDGCGISFRQKDGLKHHVNKYHKEKDKEQSSSLSSERFVCCVCDRKLSSKYSLNVHMKKHTAEQGKPDLDLDSEATVATCKENANKSDSKLKSETSKSLEAVSEGDGEEDSLGITALQMAAGNAGAAGLRMKQYQCGKCFKSFHIKRNLLRHLKNHDFNSLELYECTECGIGFDTKRSLKLHRHNDHKDVIPDLNNCEYCNAPFITVSDLSEHIAVVHDAIEQDCPHCEEHFVSQKLYYDHLLEHQHMLGD